MGDGEFLMKLIEGMLSALSVQYIQLVCVSLGFLYVILFFRKRFRKKNFYWNLFFLCGLEQLFVLIYYCRKLENIICRQRKI